jgi:CubicO group peptidase (beta-lactamase class C family)
MTAFGRAHQVLVDGRAARVFPGATTEVGDSAGVMWTDEVGTLTFDASAGAVDLATPFDLASLTKVIATTTVAMQLVEVAALDVEMLVGDVFSEWSGADRQSVRIRDLLEHASGLPARLVDAPPATPREFVHDICAMPLEYPVRSRSIYSDLGFILLGLALEQRGGASLAVQFVSLARSRFDLRSATRSEAPRRTHAADGRGFPPRPSARRRSSRQLRRRIGRRRRPCRPVRQRRRRRRICEDRPWRGPRRLETDAVFSRSRRRIRHPIVGAGKLARARVGHDARDLVVRDADVGIGLRARRFYRHVALDRPGPRSLLRAPDQPRLRWRID